MTEPSDIRQERAIMAAGALARHAEGDLTRISGLTDEEILALVGPEHAAAFDLPWVVARERAGTGFSRDEARLSSLRSLLVRGGVTQERTIAAAEGRESGTDPGTFTPSALLTGILTRRSLAPRALRVSGPEQDDATVLRVFVDSDGTVMHELASPDGLHHFFMSDLSHAGVSLLGRLDPEGATTASAQDQEVITGTWSELDQDAAIGPVLSSATTRSLLEIDDRSSHGHHEIVVAVSPSGTAVIRSAEDGDDLEAVLVSRSELEELIATLLRTTDGQV